MPKIFTQPKGKRRVAKTIRFGGLAVFFYKWEHLECITCKIIIINA